MNAPRPTLYPGFYPSPYSALLARLAFDPSAPLITDLDLEAQTRVELSVATACNGVAKAAHLFSALAEELGRPPRIGLALPPHWQTWTLALGAWAVSADLVIDEDLERLSATDLDGLVLGPDHVSDPRSDLPDDLPDSVWVSRLHPFGLPFDAAPLFPLEDLTAALRPQPDEPPAQGADAPAVTSDPEAEALSASLDPSARILTTLPWTSAAGLRCAFALPLEHRRSVILVRGVGDDLSTLERAAAGEDVAATAGVDLPGCLRIG